MATVCCLLAGTSRAQVDVCDRQDSALDPGLQRHFATEWPAEAERLKSNPENVSREGDRLQLRLEGGGTVELADCLYGNSFHAYLYERYDAAGRFYVVSRSGNEDFAYTLVMRKTGKPFTVFATPIWASDKDTDIGGALQRVLLEIDEIAEATLLSISLETMLKTNGVVE
jgi:hypothetical protein